MDNKTAQQIIIEALHIAITKGAYGLVEVQNIVKALEVFNQDQQQPTEDLEYQD